MLKVFKDAKTRNRFLLSSAVVTVILSVSVNKFLSLLFIVCTLLDTKDIELEVMDKDVDAIEMPKVVPVIEVHKEKEEIKKLKIHVSEDRNLRNKRNFKDFDFDMDSSYVYTPSGFEIINNTVRNKSVQHRNKITIITDIKNSIDTYHQANYLSELKNNLDEFDDTLSTYYSNLLSELNTFNKYIQFRVDYYSNMLDEIKKEFYYINLAKDLDKIFSKRELFLNVNLEYETGNYFCGIIYITQQGIFCIGNISKLCDLLGVEIIDIKDLDIDKLRDLKPKYSVVEVKQFKAMITTHLYIDEFYTFKDFRKEVNTNLELFKKEKIENLKRIDTYLNKIR